MKGLIHQIPSTEPTPGQLAQNGEKVWNVYSFWCKYFWKRGVV